MSGAVTTGGNNGPLAAGSVTTPTPIKTAAYTANPGDFVPVDTSGGAVTVTLPAQPPDGSAVTVMMVNQASGNAVTVAASAADVIGNPSGTSSWSMTMQNQRATFQYVRALGVWYVVNDGVPLTQGKVQGPLSLANVASAPATPTGGVVAYSIGGVMTYTNPQGLVNTIVGSQGGATAAGTPIANTTAETALQTMSLPANDAIAGAVYRMVAWGVFSWTGTPTITFTSRLGGTGGTQLAQVPAITLGTAQTNATWKHETFLNFLSPTSVQCMIELDLGSSSATDAASPYVATPTSATAVTLTSTKAWVLDVTWGTAAAGNTLQMLAGYTERVA